MQNRNCILKASDTEIHLTSIKIKTANTSPRTNYLTTQLKFYAKIIIVMSYESYEIHKMYRVGKIKAIFKAHNVGNTVIVRLYTFIMLRTDIPL